MIAPTHPLLMPRAVGPTGPRLAAARFALVAALALLCVLALASPAPALEQKLTATSVNLGYSVAVDGDTLVLGDPLDSAGVGAVYVFRRSGDSWANTARLTASDGSAGDVLGVSVAIEGDTIVAGASGDGVQQNATGQGSVYTFARTGAPDRTQTAKLTDAEGAARAEFGLRVGIDGGTIVAGAPLNNSASVFFSPLPPPTPASVPAPAPAPAPARASAAAPPPPPPPGKPALAKLAVKPKTIRRASAASSTAAKPRITFTLSAAASVELRSRGPGRAARSAGRA